ncbi:hypothetical protein M1N80_04095, partial [Peptococcaceae bacterium]|nr:hypothetical protein [Peptococcaceae bacterium]
PDKVYLPVLTPGYIIFLEHNNKLYRYHTDTCSRYVRAWEWRGWIRPIPPIIIPPPDERDRRIIIPPPPEDIIIIPPPRPTIPYYV